MKVLIRAMDTPDYFESVGNRGFFRPIGNLSLEETVEGVASAIQFAREQGIQELLVNVSALTGFDSPSIFERYQFVEKWASVARGKVRIAMVARAEMIDSQKFGVTVAANRGLVGDVFTTEAEAVAWLDGKG